MEPGARLGPYEIIARLGAGGMGEVYRARDTRLGREVAVKVLPATFSSDPDRLRRFEREAEAASLLNHPNITAVFDIGTHDGSPYVVSELLEGGTLRSRLASGALGPRRAIEFAIQAARGLAAAHDKGIVHRDLKPENMFVTKDGRVKILDFGLAKLIRPEPTTSAATEPGVVLGTFGYMSPEQVRGRVADPRSDIFSFGAILYEMLSGHRAFRGDSAASTMSAILTREPPELSTVNPNVHPGLERIVRHCLEKDPEERFQSARDLAFDLEALSGVSAPTTAGIALGPVRRRNWGKPLAAAALLLGGLLAGWLLHNALRKPVSPAYQSLGLRLGGVFSARFAPDGQTVIYSTSWAGAPYRIFSRNPAGKESRDLGLPDGDLLAVSSSGEMAISIGRRESIEGTGTLARVPLAGGSPHEILKDARLADWSPDGTALAVVRRAHGRTRIEYPVGRLLYETGAEIGSMRLSPRGDRIAFIEQDPNGFFLVNVVDLSAKRSTVSEGWEFARGLAWWPDGGEIWFTGRRSAGKDALYAVTLSGRERLVRQEASGLFLDDIFKDGRILISDYAYSRSVAVVASGETSERDLSWLDLPWIAAISSDGSAILFDQRGEGGTGRGAICLRRVDGSPAIALGEGGALGLSPDGRWVLSQLSEPGGQERFLLLPAGPGQARSIGHRGVASILWGGFFPDGRRILFLGQKGKRPLRLYVQDLSGGEPQPISPEGMLPGAVPISPDGRWIAAPGPDSKILLCRADGGTPRPLATNTAGDWPIAWSAEGRWLYVYSRNELPARVFRLNVETGRREFWKEIAPADRTGLDHIDNILMTPDARAFAYGYRRILGSLQIVQGLR
ncbi:MAG: protein kinase domain-containing protein [Thermoanaerobaculia bacterium]